MASTANAVNSNDREHGALVQSIGSSGCVDHGKDNDGNAHVGGGRMSAGSNSNNGRHPSNALQATLWNALTGCEGVDGPSSIDDGMTVQE
jgi:hypothetical protein